jgi:uncharacterized protein
LIGWLLAACAGPAPPPEPDTGPARPTLWRASQASRGDLVLLGSVHVGSERMRSLGPQVDAAFEGAAELVLEADLRSLGADEMAALAERYGRVAPPETLGDRLSEKTLRLFERHLQARGWSPAVFREQQPWLVSTTLMVLEFQRLGYDPALGVDRLLAERAVAEGKPIGAIESIEFQFATLAGLPLALQDRLLRGQLERADEIERDAVRMINAWGRGDDAVLAEIVFRQIEEDAATLPYYERVLFDRNRHMAERLDTLAEDGRPRLVVVGAAHLLGDRGIPALLRARGYRLDRLQGMEETR